MPLKNMENNIAQIHGLKSHPFTYGGSISFDFVDNEESIEYAAKVSVEKFMANHNKVFIQEGQEMRVLDLFTDNCPHPRRPILATCLMTDWRFGTKLFPRDELYFIFRTAIHMCRESGYGFGRLSFTAGEANMPRMPNLPACQFEDAKEDGTPVLGIHLNIAESDIEQFIIDAIETLLIFAPNAKKFRLFTKESSFEVGYFLDEISFVVGEFLKIYQEKIHISVEIC